MNTEEKPQENILQKIYEEIDRRKASEKESDKLLLSLLKDLNKEYSKNLKLIGGKRKKIKDPNAPKKPPSGFAKPVMISDELYKFLKDNVDKDIPQLISRPTVIRNIGIYVRDNKLGDENNGQIIHLDRKGGEEFSKLLKGLEGNTVNYLKLQKYILHHFPPKKQVKSTEVKSEGSSKKEKKEKKVVEETDVPVKMEKSKKVKA